VKLPPIAKLTRLEARAARAGLPDIRTGRDMLPAGAPNRLFVEAVVREIEVALAEYDSRGWLRRLVAPLDEHRTRLRPWMVEVELYTEARLAEIDDGGPCSS